MMQTLHVRTKSRMESRDVTSEIQKLVETSGVKSGICYLYVPHTTAGVAINENDDPNVMADVQDMLQKLVPSGAGYKHLEGNADSHIKATLVGSSQWVPIEEGRLALGRWQGIFFCEFDGPRERKLQVKILGG
jgi:secondary thiamine-phosphate synthase enzyme